MLRPNMTQATVLLKSSDRSTMLPASFAASDPEFIANPMSALYKAGASLVPSPVTATTPASIASG